MSEQIEGAINQQPFEDWFARIQKTPLNEGVLAEVALAAYRLGYQQGIAPVVAPVVMGSADQQAASEIETLRRLVDEVYDDLPKYVNTACERIEEYRRKRAATKDGIAP